MITISNKLTTVTGHVFSIPRNLHQRLRDVGYIRVMFTWRHALRPTGRGFQSVITVRTLLNRP